MTLTYEHLTGDAVSETGESKDDVLLVTGYINLLKSTQKFHSVDARVHREFLQLIACQIGQQANNGCLAARGGSCQDGHPVHFHTFHQAFQRRQERLQKMQVLSEDVARVTMSSRQKRVTDLHV